MARILIVDDDKPDRIVMSTILERAGHETFLAEDGEEALREYLGKAIDVVVTDLHMPLCMAWNSSLRSGTYPQDR